MEERRDSYAYLWIEGSFSPSTITEMVGIPATESHKQGDPIPSRPGEMRELSCWKLHSPLPRDEVFIDSHISALLRLLESKIGVIDKLRSMYHIGIDCVGVYTNANPGFHMDEELIQKLAELKLSVDFDLYCYCDHEDKSGTV